MTITAVNPIKLSHPAAKGPFTRCLSWGAAVQQDAWCVLIELFGASWISVTPVLLVDWVYTVLRTEAQVTDTIVCSGMQCAVSFLHLSFVVGSLMHVVFFPRLLGPVCLYVRQHVCHILLPSLMMLCLCLQQPPAFMASITQIYRLRNTSGKPGTWPLGRNHVAALASGPISTSAVCWPCDMHVSS